MDLENFLKGLISVLIGSLTIIFLFTHTQRISSCVKQFSN